MIKSKYYKSWEEYKAEHPEISEREEKAMAARMQTYEEMMYGFVMFLLI
ncbi:MAG TPA: hypothetical protein GX699_04865 [Firmicutes bacterium]|nr:hypothetical protein [Bacillota bacterium]